MTEPDVDPLMMGSSNYAAFISYSWTSERHRQWVLELATRLRADGVDVILDVWDLRPGQDKHAFMEKAVLDEAIRKVLIICDEGYKEKADKRSSGVGVETELISAEVYVKVDQEKFIPIVAQRDARGQALLPRYLGSRVYIDLSQVETFEAQYQQLLRNIYGKPESERPPLGEPPAFLFEEPGPVPESASIVQTRIEDFGSAGKPSNFIGRFFGRFVSDMEKFRFSEVAGEPYDETMLKIIEQMRPLRDTFIGFADQISQVSLSSNDIDLIHDGLESLAQLQFRPWNITSFQTTDWDNYRFVNYELILYLVTKFVQHGRFHDLAQLVDATYFYDSNTKRQAHSTIAVFDLYIATLEERRKNRLQLNRVSVTADLIRSRAEGSGVSFRALVESDQLLYYLTLLNPSEGGEFERGEIWFPRLSVFASNHEGNALLRKLISRRHFARVKDLFGVNTTQELEEKILHASEKEAKYSQEFDSFYYSIAPLTQAIPLSELATVP